MSFTDKILQHSKSYNYYKRKYEDLIKNNEKLKKELNNKNKELNKLKKEHENVTTLNLAKTIKIENAINLLVREFNGYKQ